MYVRLDLGVAALVYLLISMQVCKISNLQAKALLRVQMMTKIASCIMSPFFV